MRTTLNRARGALVTLLLTCLGYLTYLVKRRMEAATALEAATASDMPCPQMLFGCGAR
jgi:hypothetical protein